MKVKGIVSPQLSGEFSKTHYVAYYPHLGVSIIKKKPTRKKNKKPSTTQLNQSNKFTSMIHFAKRNLRHLIRPIWKKYNMDSCTGYHLFLKKNKYAFSADGETFNKANVFASVGELPNEFDYKIILSEDESHIDIKWTCDINNTRSRMLDTLCLGFFKDERYIDLHFTDIKRQTGEAVINNKFKLKKCDYIYLFFRSYDKSKYSESIAICL